MARFKISKISSWRSGSVILIINLLIISVVSSLNHFIFFPWIFSDSVHSFYFSKSDQEVRKLIESRTLECDRVAEEFWSDQQIGDRRIREAANGKVKLQILIITTKRTHVDFVKHTARKLHDQGIIEHSQMVMITIELNQ